MWQRCVKRSSKAAVIRSPSTKVAAVSAVNLWTSKGIGRCDFLKLDCEGAEVGILAGLAGAGLLAGVRLVVGEWHAEDNSEKTTEGVKRALRQHLQATHDVIFSPHGSGREGYFTAKSRRAGAA
jgi:hypothetical protein